MIEDTGIYQRLGEITENLIAVNQRLDRIERQLEKVDNFDVLAAKVDGIEKNIGKLETDMAGIHKLPVRFVWAVVLALAAGIGSLVMEVVKR